MARVRLIWLDGREEVGELEVGDGNSSIPIPGVDGYTVFDPTDDIDDDGLDIYRESPSR
jgi:hypothetical protein